MEQKLRFFFLNEFWIGQETYSIVSCSTKDTSPHRGFLSGGFTSMVLINPSKRKLTNAPLCTAGLMYNDFVAYLPMRITQFDSLLSSLLSKLTSCCHLDLLPSYDLMTVHNCELRPYDNHSTNTHKCQLSKIKIIYPRTFFISTYVIQYSSNMVSICDD